MNFIQLLDEAQITIPLISKEVVSDLVMRIVGPQNKTQQAFYIDKKGTMFSILDQDPNGKTMLEGDPGLYYHEYCLALARIGLEVTKDFEDKRKRRHAFNSKWKPLNSYASSSLTSWGTTCTRKRSKHSKRGT